ncbi:MAG: hypothetical protein A3K19_02875 [Lentisphaerae bacterium RIFOXYB12_FULL_65_16]|nr:MAG: hypothetical protein A3K18_19925 [Lentisphaerae bacterium RIFOXYA12_64_32]OGV92295.1 MAG: hypothetical protein A3K19_02875 [Lentisphaerae bacterium RIFOXYB12_FULL_65_16]
MACHAEHWNTLDFALNHASWTRAQFGYSGWRAGGKDPFNRLTTYPDEIRDWLYQKPPRVTSVIDIGLAAAHEAFAVGRTRLAAARLAFTGHYLADALAVSHTWLDFIADESMFESGEVIHKHFHDPVEYPAVDYIHEAQPKPVIDPRPFPDIFADAQRRAYAIGRDIFDAFFAGREVRPLVLAGVENSAQTMLCLFESVRTAQLPCAAPADIERTQREWVLMPMFEWEDEVLSRPFEPATIRGFKSALGYEGGDIFTALDRCTPPARADGLRWRDERRVWRATTMRGILPPNPVSKVGPDWRPETAVRATN